MKEIIHFLRELRMHNNREWFNAHKDEYTRLRKTFETYINQLIVLIGAKRISTHRDNTAKKTRNCTVSKHRSAFTEYIGISVFLPTRLLIKPISPHIWPGAEKIVRVPDITYI